MSVCDPFTTWWDFLSAVAKFPKFCDGQAAGVYSRMRSEAMCAKEMAGLYAIITYFTNGWDDAMVDAN